MPHAAAGIRGLTLILLFGESFVKDEFDCRDQEEDLIRTHVKRSREEIEQLGCGGLGIGSGQWCPGRR